MEPAWISIPPVIITKVTNREMIQIEIMSFKLFGVIPCQVIIFLVLGMTSLMDEDEGLERLAGALHEIDAKVAEDVSNGNKILKNPASDEKYHSFIEKIYQKYPREMQIYQAEELPYKEVTLEEAVGNMSADTIYLYPPGIPMIVPGEIITKRLADNIEECLSLGLRIEGSSDVQEKILKIVYF